MAESFTLKELAEVTQTALRGDANKLIKGVAAIDQATADEISFVRDKQYARFLKDSSAGALILTEALAENYAGNCLVSSNPYLTYAHIVTALHPTIKPPPGVHPSAILGENVSLGEAVSIGPNAVLGANCKIGNGGVIGAGCVLGDNCQLGKNNFLHPNVTLANDTLTGNNVTLHSGAVMGADGFGFVPQQTGWYKIPQIGRVVLGNDVEIGANTTVDRAAMGDTLIGNGVKLDNLIHIAHNVQIGDHTVIAACTGIAGSAKIGKRCQISGMVSIAGHLSVADDTTITATSFVINSITEAGVYSSGTTVADHALWRKNAVRFRQLDQLSRRVNELEKQLKKQLAAQQNSENSKS